MMTFCKDTPIYLHRLPVDFRKAINGLSVIVQEDLGRNPFEPAFYVFTNKSHNRIKILYWDANGFCLWHKRLEKDHFIWPKRYEKACIELNAQELECLLVGYDICRIAPHQRLTYAAVI